MANIGRRHIVTTPVPRLFSPRAPASARRLDTGIQPLIGFLHSFDYNGAACLHDKSFVPII
ncbi:MAG: hypothetical protein WAK66_18885, partial [Methylocystis sp.]